MFHVKQKQRYPLQLIDNREKGKELVYIKLNMRRRPFSFLYYLLDFLCFLSKSKRLPFGSLSLWMWGVKEKDMGGFRHYIKSPELSGDNGWFYRFM